MKPDAQVQLGFSFRKQLLLPQLQEGQKVGLGQMRPLAGKRKNLTPTGTGTRRIRTVANGIAKVELYNKGTQ